MLTVELHQAEIPRIFARFQNVINERHWLDQAAKIESEAANKPVLADLLKKDYELTLQLAACSRLATQAGGRLRVDYGWNTTLYPAITFAAQSLDLIDRARGHSNKRANSLIRRIQTGFTNPIDAQAMQLEFWVATHFSQAGHTLSWPEIDGGKDHFDIFIESLGPMGLEVECKLATVNKGRKVHRSEAANFFDSLKPELQSSINDLRTGLCVVLTIPERMPTSIDETQVLVQLTKQSILTARKQIDTNVANIRIVEFNVSELGQLQNPPTIGNRKAIERLSNTQNRETMIIGNGRGGLLVAILQSAQADSVVHEIFATLSDSAKRQLTGKRPGILIVGLQGMRHEQLRSVATDDRDPSKPVSALGSRVSSFHNQSDLEHVVGVGFFSQPTDEIHPLIYQSRGASYYFPKRTSPFWNEAYSGIF